jgi:hypothetical protein
VLSTAALNCLTHLVLALLHVQAVATFLKGMSLTPADAGKRPQLLDALLSYHVIPFVKGSGAMIVAGGW